MYLKDRGVTFTGYIRRELITLCECVASLDLPVFQDVSDISCTPQTLSHLNINCDPFLLQGYSNNLSQCLEIGIYDVFNYLVSFRPDYDRRKLRAYKSFQDYRLFADGHVNSVEYADATDTIGIFKASVKPTQRDKTYLKSEFYNPWIAVEKNNVDIKSAYCQCPGGSDGACRHIAATLFDIEAFEKKSVTDGPSLWTKRPSSHDEPVPLGHLKVKKISYGQTLADTNSDLGQENFDPRPISDRANPSLEQLADFAASLHQINPNACALESLLDPTDTETQATKINEECAAMSIVNKLQALDLSPDTDISQDAINRLRYCTDDITYIEHETTGQSENPTWSVMRKGMVTTSNFKRVCTRADSFEKNNNIDCSNLVKCLLHDSRSIDNSNVPSSIVWGRKKESKAKEMYKQIERRRHKKLSVKIKGLLIDKENPFLGTSVDGTVECQCKENHQNKLLEIKCPWALRDCDPKTVAQC
ncbi:uncharacterized protein LOC124275939 [Haliotis rubra]|uniref:uncharacterized protein LOC124275939 n=1 Tax=Haliotis rubra TaxID=36100 RepID=UPI001EE6202A|nr:uncharacterized protein LOC124275939 [Haliotis rubra]